MLDTAVHAPTGLADRPVLAPDVQLLGEMPGTGFVDRQWLLRRQDRFIQVTELLYRIAECLTGEHTLQQVAAAVSESTEWTVTADHVRQLVQAKLVPLGLVAGSATPAASPRSRSPLQIAGRRTLLGPRALAAIVGPLQVLYTPAVLVPLLLVSVAALTWVYLIHGVVPGIRAALYTPGGLLLVVALVLAAGLFHELGHAAALRYGGGVPRRLGVGLYLVYPTFYTDVSDAYRLGRWARLRTDLGGMYFHLVFALGVIGLHAVVRHEVLLAVVMAISIDLLYQCMPYARLDGYWALVDLAGVPDFFSQMRPFLRSLGLVDTRGGASLPRLKRSATVAFVVYLALVVPTLVLVSLLFVRGVPRFGMLAADALLQQLRVASNAARDGDVVMLAAIGSQVALLVLAILAAAHLVYSLGRTFLRTLWNWSRPTPSRRLAGAVITAVTVAFLALLWGPELPSARPPAPIGVTRLEIAERSHVTTPVVYPHHPPVGGNHAPVWQNCGFYGRPVTAENAVHSLEHGAVWITYGRDLPREARDVLRKLAARQTHILVSELPESPATVVASSWGHQLHLDSVDDPRLDQFIRRFRLGPDAPERGGPCTGGAGTPDG